jgi:hypothetical protein
MTSKAPARAGTGVMSARASNRVMKRPPDRGSQPVPCSSVQTKEFAMKTWTAVTALCVACLAPASHAQPSEGMWEFSMKMEGAPAGGGARSGKACLAAGALAAAPEQTLFEAAEKSAPSARGSLKCDLGAVTREAGKSSWQAQCEGPMGKMQGTGSGTLAAETAELQQLFTLKAAFGTLNLKQTISARRVGSC